MVKAALVGAVVIFGAGFAFGRGWVPLDESAEPGIPGNLSVTRPASSPPSSYSHLRLHRGAYGEAEGSIVVRNNTDEPVTVMPTVTLYDGDTTLSQLFGRADRMKPHTEQTVRLTGGDWRPYTDVAVDLMTVPE